MNSSLFMEPEQFREYINRAVTKFIFEKDPNQAVDIFDAMAELYEVNFRTGIGYNHEILNSFDLMSEMRIQTQNLTKYYVEAITHGFADETKETLEFKLKEWKLGAEEQLGRLTDERAAYVLKNNIQPSQSKYIKTD